MTPAPVALVTAGSAGLGYATSTLFAKNGWRVAINYHNNETRAKESVDNIVQSSISKTSEDFTYIRADLAKRSEIEDLVEKTLKTFGRLDAVFSNGGYTNPRDINDLEDNLWEDDWDNCFNVNVKSHLWLMAAAKKHLNETKGAFVTTSSMAGVTASGSSMAYSVTKAAQIHLVKSLANACGPNIRVNSVSPGLMLTDWGRSAFSEERQQQLKEKTKLKEFVTVEDVAEQVLCFVRSKGVTGANAVIDAGISI